MKQLLIALAITVFFGAFALTTQATEKPQTLEVSDSAIDSALKESRRDALLAPIKSEADLYNYLDSTPEEKNPLNALSNGARQRFLDSLVFTENGLGGFNYSDLESELTVTQVYIILSLFGVQRTTPFVKGAKVLDETDKAILASPMMVPIDHDNYLCSARATCSRSAQHICTSNC